ncbi:MAG: HisA/HisF-related TIM barrel protein [Pirellulaceae bacterium]|nr:HisA/HisF-related TIM barrel protein [Pirellulaceae bacterium]
MPQATGLFRRFPDMPTEELVVLRGASGENFLDVIPVLDLLGGQVVRGVGGERATYQPIVSGLCAGSKPLDIATAFVRQLCLTRQYIADLDALGGATPNWDLYRELFQSTARFMIDAGIRDAETAQEWHRFALSNASIEGVIVALESISKLSRLEKIFHQLGQRQAIFSLDMKGGKLFTGAADIWEQSPIDVIEQVFNIGFRRFIVLDLADVGMFGGTRVASLCQQIRTDYPEIELVSGGGLREASDLQRLADAGCDGALIASALHQGMIGAVELQRWRRHV